MPNKRILIVDDDESILAVLARALEKLSPSYQVCTVTDGFAALGQLEKQAFDLVVTDYKMAGMDGLELLAAIRFMQPQARVIVVTAYGDNALEGEARRQQAYRFLAKPLEIAAFREAVQDALSDVAISRPGILILSDDRYRQVNDILERLRLDVNGRCVLLTDPDGRILARTGNVEKLPFEAVASLLGGGIAILLEAGRTLDGDNEATNLAYREGKYEYLYTTNIGQRLLLILVIDRSPYSTRLGSVWYYAQQTASALSRIVGEAEYSTPQEVFGDSMDNAFGQELDKLFGME